MTEDEAYKVHMLYCDKYSDCIFCGIYSRSNRFLLKT